MDFCIDFTTVYHVFSKEKKSYLAINYVVKNKIMAGIDFTTPFFHPNMVNGEYVTSGLNITFTLPVPKQNITLCRLCGLHGSMLTQPILMQGMGTDLPHP